MGNSREKYYLSDSCGSGSITSDPSINPDHLSSGRETDHSDKERGFSMDTESYRSSATNRELQTAKKIYETQTAMWNKHKIADMEASVKEEEMRQSEEDISGEVDWLLDPGTPSK